MLWACLLTWVFSAFALLLMTASLVFVTVSPDPVFDELHRQNPDLAREGVTDDMILSATYVMGAVAIVFALVAIVIAVQAFRRRGWARIGLVGCGSVTATFSLLAVIGSAVMLLPLAAGIATLGLMVRPDVKAWFAAAERRP